MSRPDVHESSDLQSRLVAIGNRALKVEIKNRSDEERKDIEELAYLVGYLANVVRIHFGTGER